MNDRELRFCDIELRIGEGEKPRIVGYAAVFNSLSGDLGGFREQISPGAFSDVLASGGEILALVNHDPKLVVGRRSAGTLVLREDAKGLFVEIDPPNTTVGRDLVENIRRQDVKGMSFMFKNPISTWERRGNERIRTISKIGMMPEVTFTAIPAYEATSADVRSHLDQFDREDKATPRRDAARRRLRLLAAK